MELTELQIELLRCLSMAVEGKPTRRVVYCSEWLGYLPYGLYHWVEVEGQDISSSLPLDWSRSDLEALKKTGFLTILNVWRNADDELEECVTYQVSPSLPASNIDSRSDR